MPRMTGAEFYLEVHRRYPGLAGRFALLTGGPTSPELLEFLGATTLPVLRKPVDAAALRAFLAAG